MEGRDGQPPAEAIGQIDGASIVAQDGLSGALTAKRRLGPKAGREWWGRRDSNPHGLAANGF